MVPLAPVCVPAGVKSLRIPMGHRDCFPMSCLEGLELGRPMQKAPTPRSLTGSGSLGRVVSASSVPKVTCPGVSRIRVQNAVTLLLCPRWLEVAFSHSHTWAWSLKAP